MAARKYLRDGVTVFFILATAPLWALVRLLGHGSTGSSVFMTFGQLLSLIPGVIGAFARRAFYVMTLEDCARDVGVGFGTWFSKRKVRIAPQVSIGAHCLIGSCTIGQGTLLGSNIDILSGRHQHSQTLGQEKIAGIDSHFSQIHVGENVWIGNRAIIMADVGGDSVIGAGSVVVHNVPACTLAAGNPAAVKRQGKCPSHAPITNELPQPN
jgi:acetyltransferase-like isoleucine patch superfamily enzyme